MSIGVIKGVQPGPSDQNIQVAVCEKKAIAVENYFFEKKKATLLSEIAYEGSKQLLGHASSLSDLVVEGVRMGKWFFRGKTVRWVGGCGTFAFFGLSVWDGADSAAALYKSEKLLEKAELLPPDQRELAVAERENSLWGIAIAISDLVCATLLLIAIVFSASISPWITASLAALSVALIIVQYQRYRQNVGSCEE